MTLYRSGFFWFWTAYAFFGLWMLISNNGFNISDNHVTFSNLDALVGLIIVLSYLGGLGAWLVSMWWYSWHDVWTGKRTETKQ